MMLQLSEIILNEGVIEVPPALFQEVKNFVLYRWKEIAFDSDNKNNLGAKRKRLEFLKNMKSKYFYYIFNQILKAANNPKGRAKARENPNITKNGPKYDPDEAASTNAVPMIGPVHENDTSASVNAMKNIPSNPPLSAI